MSRCLLPLLLLLGLPISGCDKTAGEEEEVDPEPCLDEGRSECLDGLTFRTCTDHYWDEGELCASPTPQCSVALGCIACGAGQEYCVNNAVFRCSADGTDWEQIDDCGATSECRWGQCFDPCELAEEEASYLGCDFLAVSTANSELQFAFDTDFAVVVGNGHDERSVQVQVTKGGTEWANETIGPNETRAISLAFDASLKASDESVIVLGGAYEIHSDYPIVAYQYNPLNFQRGGDFSYTNDASLLLPAPALGQQHIVSTWPTFGIVESAFWTWSPGFVAIAAAEDGTSVHVASSAYTLGGDVAALSPGQSLDVNLNRGDVLQVFSERGTPDGGCGALEGAIQGDATIFSIPYPVCLDVARGDLTGTRVDSDKPVAVFAGHDCSFVPFERWACDHLEESVLPLEIWGVEAVVSAPLMPGGGAGTAPTLVRVIALQDGTEIRFTPPIHEPAIAGPFTPVELRVDQDVLISADIPILVTQLLLGEQELGVDAGDPAMGTMPPTDHWRSSYDFLVPSTYEDDHVNLVARAGADVYIDDILINEWALLDDTPYKVHRARLFPGPHTARSDNGSPFGLVAYGYASYTSYLYPGGLDLTHNPLP